MGFDLAKFLKIAEFVVPSALAVSGVPPTLVPLVQHGIQLAETVSASAETPLTGAEKKAVALDAVATGIAAVNAITPGTIDPDVTRVVGSGIDTAVGVINLVQRAQEGARA